MLAGFVFKTLNENGVEIDNHFDLDQVLIKIDTDRAQKTCMLKRECLCFLSNLI